MAKLDSCHVLGSNTYHIITNLAGRNRRRWITDYIDKFPMYSLQSTLPTSCEGIGFDSGLSCPWESSERSVGKVGPSIGPADGSDASRRNRTNSGSCNGNLMIAMTDIFVRLSPERMDQARDLVVDTEVTASTSLSLTLL